VVGAERDAVELASKHKACGGRRSSGGRRKPCRLAPIGIAEIDQWLAILRNALAKNYDRLDEVLAAMDPEER